MLVTMALVVPSSERTRPPIDVYGSDGITKKNQRKIREKSNKIK